MKVKKTLVVILAITMVMGISNIAIATAISRGGFPDTKDSAQVNAISYLKALGILKGDGDTGNFRPNHYLTRQEFAVIVARIGDPIPGIDITVNQSPGLPPPPPPPPMTSPISPYVDDTLIADWAQDAVAKVREYGWVKGYEDGSFGPTNNLTYAEAITVLLRVLGHEDAIDQSQWPATYIAKAMELEMNLGVDSSSNTVISRAEMARLTYNTLFISRLVEQNGELISIGPMIGNLTGLDQVDKNLKGNWVQFYVGDLDMDGDGYGHIMGYREIRSPSGQTVELWRYLQEIKKLTMEYTEAEKKNSMLADLSTPSSEQRVADLKKLADELVNVIKLDTSGNYSDIVIPNIDTGPAQLVADLKKLADELVNVYKLAPDLVLIGAESSNELIGRMIKVTFNSEGQIFIIEAGSSINN